MAPEHVWLLCAAFCHEKYAGSAETARCCLLPGLSHRETSSEVQCRSASFPVQVLVSSRLGKMSQWETPAFVTKLKRGQAPSLEAYLYGFYFLVNLILLIPYDSTLTISSNGLFIGVHLIIC